MKKCCDDQLVINRWATSIAGTLLWLHWLWKVVQLYYIIRSSDPVLANSVHNVVLLVCTLEIIPALVIVCLDFRCYILSLRQMSW